MKVLLTGITGNLGYEVSLDLARRDISLIPCVRASGTEFLSNHPQKFDQVVIADLTGAGELDFSGKVDCIVHCAGVVHFKNAGDKNEQMMIKVTKLAKKLAVPIYYASTAFLYKPTGVNLFNNDYELDKYRAEQVLISSGIPHAIFRPSILTGNSVSGAIRNFSGYYLIVRAFLDVVSKAIGKKRPIRFPQMHGGSNIVPVDQTAECIGKIIEEWRLGQTFYVTNPAPPPSDWVLDETLNFFSVRQWIVEPDISFEEFLKLDLTEEEQTLSRFASYFMPYWSLQYEFPKSICSSNLIDHNYLTKALTVFRGQEQSNHEHKNH
jgi:thioester reductase-like protein